MSDENRPKTVDAVQAELTRARDWIGARIPHLVLEATIQDYPIGRRDRGKCKLGVERAKGKGYRTVRTTTDKHGRWCAPKKSTFQDNCIVVVHDGLGDDRSCWLKVGTQGVYAGAPNGDHTILAQSPSYFKPRRTEERYTIVIRTARMVIGGDGVTPEPKSEERQEHVNPADPAELCDAYDTWLAGVADLRKLLASVWDMEQKVSA